MSGYYRVLNALKRTHAHEIAERYGSVEQFDEVISTLRSCEHEPAAMAVRQYGSVD